MRPGKISVAGAGRSDERLHGFEPALTAALEPWMWIDKLPAPWPKGAATRSDSREHPAPTTPLPPAAPMRPRRGARHIGHRAGLRRGRTGRCPRPSPSRRRSTTRSPARRGRRHRERNADRPPARRRIALGWRSRRTRLQPTPCRSLRTAVGRKGRATCASSCRPRAATRRSSTTAGGPSRCTTRRPTPSTATRRPAGKGHGSSAAQGDSVDARTHRTASEPRQDRRGDRPRAAPRERLRRDPHRYRRPGRLHRAHLAQEGGSLLGGAELSFDAVHGVPLRAAIYSSTSSAPVIELTAERSSPTDRSKARCSPSARRPSAKVVRKSREQGIDGATSDESGRWPDPKMTHLRPRPGDASACSKQTRSKSHGSALPGRPAEGADRRATSAERAAHGAGNGPRLRARRRPLPAARRR